MHSRRRIALISFHTCPQSLPGTGDAGGMNVYIRELAPRLAARGWRLDIFTRGQDCCNGAPLEISAGVRLYHVSAEVDRFAAEVRNVSQREGAGYSHVLSQYWLSGLVGMELKRHWGAAHFAGFHTLAAARAEAFPAEPISPKRFPAERRVVREADGVLATSEHERRLLIERYDADPARVFLAAPGVDAARFRPLEREDCRTLLGIDPSERMLLFVGRLAPLKGVDVLLAALAQLRERERLVAWIVGGTRGSPEQAALEALASSLGIGRRVRFLGSVEHQRLPDFFGAADLCVLPSYYESFGMAALEAMSCGRAVIASRSGGITSFIEDGLDGLLTAPGSVDELAVALERALNDPALRVRIERQARARALRFTWEQTADGVERALASSQEGGGVAGANLAPEPAAVPL